MALAAGHRVRATARVARGIARRCVETELEALGVQLANQLRHAAREAADVPLQLQACVKRKEAVIDVPME